MSRWTARTPLAERFWPKVDAKGPDECWLWRASLSVSGYGRIGLGGKRGRVEIASRVSWELSRGPIPEGLAVLHRCYNPACVNPAHLFLGTQADNVRDMYAKQRGNRPKGEDHCCARFTTEQVIALRETYATGGVSMRELAQRHGVSHRAIGRIVRRVTWVHL